MDFALSGFVFSSFRGFILSFLKENYHRFCPQWLYIFIPQRIYTVSPQRELSQILPSIALHFHLSEDLYHVSSERTVTNFALNGFIFSSLRGFIPCLLRENYHGFFPQWPFISIPQRIDTMSSQREFSWILPSVTLYFHPSEDLYHVCSERIFMDFALSDFIFSSLWEFIPCLLRENFHGFYRQWLYIFILQKIYTMSPQREFSWILPLMVLHFYPSKDLHRVSSERTFTGFTLNGFPFTLNPQ